MSDDLVLTVSAIVGAFTMGLSAGFYFEAKRWAGEAIKRGLALYDPVTGVWRWREANDDAAKGGKP